KKLKFNFKNIINLKPFDENEDNSRDDFTGSKTRSFFIYLAFFCSIAGISAVFIYPMTKAPIILISLGCASSAILSGIEWHLGYKSKALNKLFEATVLLVLLILVRLFTW
ncbi:TPA: hypothetical protein RHI40_003683, partial [Acinetobacter baumannii]|nr:hypothetical protein [Acinetobacter baumannii]